MTVPDEIRGDVPPEQVRVLRHRFRRLLVRQLCDVGGEDRLIPLLLGMEDEFEGSLRQLVTRTYDVHVPKLVASGLLEYDGEIGRLTLAVDRDAAETAIEHAET